MEQGCPDRFDDPKTSWPLRHNHCGRFDFSGKTIHPFVTYAVSELGTTMETYRSLVNGAKVSTGLAVLGETVRQADPQVRAWLRRINLLH